MVKIRTAPAITLLAVLLGFCIAGCGMEVIPSNNPLEDYEEDEQEDFDFVSTVSETGLPGTQWLWGASLLEFGEDTVTFRENHQYSYTVDLENRTGAIATLGSFTLSEDYKILEILDYRSNGLGYNGVFKLRKPGTTAPVSSTTLVGTEWNLGYSGESFLNVQWIIFFTATEALNQSGGGVFIDDYTYNSKTKRGWIYFINNFEILEKGERLYIPSYKQYGHDMTCTRVH
ncbi:MAG: hypothetical protein LBQ35_05980 [Spirochaetaceae bacterium]|jgi:hypothetical protein|nr:hypothetical protein [Spirochaetaceae bacterium]